MVRQALRRFRLGRHPAEPVLLHRLCCIGVGLSLLGVGLAGVAAAGKGLWDFTDSPPGETVFRCKCQLDKRKARLRNLEGDILVSKRRLQALRESLADPLGPSFGIARQAATDEEKVLKALQLAADGLQVQTLKKALPGLLVSLLLTLAFSVVAGRLMLVHGTHSVGAKSLTNWGVPFVAWSTLFFVIFVVREILTSVLPIEKSWFGWASFCICSEAWFLNLIILAGVGLVIGHPATLIWCFSQQSCLPAKLDLDAPDGSCGVGDYVLFVQTWALSILIFLLLGIIGWIDLTFSTEHFSAAYALPPAMLTLAALVVASRLTWNAVCIRLQYQRLVRSLAPTWSQIQKNKPVADPTNSFLGDQWWKLPATIIGALTALWAVANWLLTTKLFGAS